jgi:NADH-quinone oxidoreductase subunit M
MQGLHVHSYFAPLLSVGVLVPMATGALILALGRLRDRAALALSLAAQAAVDGLSGWGLAAFKPGVAGYQLAERHEWLPQVGVSASVGLDGISLFLYLMTAALFTLVLVSGGPRPRPYLGQLLLLEGSCLGAFASMDALLFFVFFEFSLVPAYFLIAGYGGPQRLKAALYFFLYNFAGSTFLIVAIIFLGVIHHDQTGAFSFSFRDLASTRLSSLQSELLVAAWGVAFAVKMPLFPFHTWSPWAYSEATPEVAAVLSGVTAKLGAYGFLRFVVGLAPLGARHLAPVFMTLAVVSILYGAVVAAAQRNLARVMAYSSLAHLGFVVLGVFALSFNAYSGAVLQAVNHGLIVGPIFVLLGLVAVSVEGLALGRLKGLQRFLPVLSGFVLVFFLAGLGLPGLNGFIGEFLVLTGTFVVHRWWAVAALAGSLGAVVYFLWAYQRGFHGRAQEPPKAEGGSRDMSVPRRVLFSFFVALLLFGGVYPKFFLDRISPTVDGVLRASSVAVSHPASSLHAAGRSHDQALPRELFRPEQTKGLAGIEMASAVRRAGRWRQ